MGAIAVYIENKGVTACDGVTHTHEVPRRGELLHYNNRAWLVQDVAHPSENVRGVGIHIPRVLVAKTISVWSGD